MNVKLYTLVVMYHVYQTFPTTAYVNCFVLLTHIFNIFEGKRLIKMSICVCYKYICVCVLCVYICVFIISTRSYISLTYNY